MPEPARYRPATVAVDAAIRAFLGRLAVPTLYLFELAVTPAFASRLIQESPTIFSLAARRNIADERAGKHPVGRVKLSFPPPCHSMPFVVDERNMPGLPDFRIQPAGTLRKALLDAHASLESDLAAVADGRREAQFSAIGSVPLSSLPAAEKQRLEAMVRQAQARRAR
ncbi:MAG: hypothetical protein HY816_20090 [Candidatus Wallbacteria bacterium]|nr:hypothetical protein [Candidatus Wallbacteria bacterium]